MKFPRNARIFRGQLDAAPFASVFFLVLIFILLGSRLHTPGVRVALPQMEDLPGTDRPSVSVAMDKSGRFYFESRLIQANDLVLSLSNAVRKSPEPLTLVVQADKDVTEDNLVGLARLATRAGIHDLLLATLPSASTNSLSLVPRDSP